MSCIKASNECFFFFVFEASETKRVSEKQNIDGTNMLCFFFLRFLGLQDVWWTDLAHAGVSERV